MDDAIIQAKALAKAYGGKVRALDGLSLTIQQGGIFALLGPNGAGKTTLIRVLTTLLPPDAGTARVAGIDVRQDPAGVRAQIGLAGQSAAVDGYLTGQENVEMVGRLYGLPRRQAQRRARDVLERIHLAGVADRRVKTYSGGMRCRLDLAASLVGRPRVPPRPDPGPERPALGADRHRPGGAGPGVVRGDHAVLAPLAVRLYRRTPQLTPSPSR
jgi:ABC-2 type transport system ATP-binding protein